MHRGNFEHRWDYVIVDEAQELTPVALALCLELCRDPAGLFLTADANQSLYNRGFRWQSVHEQLKVAGRTRILRRNYRSTREIATAPAFTPCVEAAGVRVSMDGRGWALDNIFIERLWRTIKYEHLYLFNYESVPALLADLHDSFIFYNNQRFHQSLAYLTPAQVHFDPAWSL